MQGIGGSYGKWGVVTTCNLSASDATGMMAEMPWSAGRLRVQRAPWGQCPVNHGALARSAGRWVEAPGPAFLSRL